MPSPALCSCGMRSFPPCLPARCRQIGPQNTPRAHLSHPQLSFSSSFGPGKMEGWVEGCWDTNLSLTFSFCFKRTCPEDTAMRRSRNVSLTEQEHKPVLFFQNTLPVLFFHICAHRLDVLSVFPTSLAGKGQGSGGRGETGTPGGSNLQGQCLTEESDALFFVFQVNVLPSFSYYPIRVNF